MISLYNIGGYFLSLYYVAVLSQYSVVVANKTEEKIIICQFIGAEGYGYKTHKPYV